jgi:imidazolonepropionase-like amidohydrolase
MVSNSLAPRVFASIIFLAVSLDASAQVAIRAKTLHTMSGPAITDGVVLIDASGKITAVGASTQVPIPTDYKVIQGEVATPGLIDARGTVGVSGILNQRQDQDQLERSSAIQPELRAIDAYNPQDRLVEWVRGFGITTIHTGHAPGELISGQTTIVKTIGTTIEDALVVETAAIAATLGPDAERTGREAPGTRAKGVAMLRAELIKAQEYAAKKARAAVPADPAKAAPERPTPDQPAKTEGTKEPTDDSSKKQAPDRNLRLEALGRVLAKEIPLLITVDRVQDIDAAIRIADEFKIRVILDSAAESYQIRDRIKAAGIDVIIHPTMFRAYGERENLSWETASKLREAGIRVAIQSGYESYVPKSRVVLYEAAIAAANGLGFADALAAITIDAARILGIQQRVGSLEVGKDGDVAVYSGDPFEYTSKCTNVVINGKIVSETPR